MKLAESLQERADLNRKVEQLRMRIQNNVLVQEGEKPAEDPDKLMKELDGCLLQLQDVMFRINATNMHTVKEGKTLIKGTRTVFDKLNKSMRKACGMEDWNKAVYELRKLCVDTVRREQGVDAAVALSGDRRETIDRYYSDPYKLTGITPIEIMAMPAI